MEVKKKFFNRIGAFVCALVVLFGCFSVPDIYRADDTFNTLINNLGYAHFIPQEAKYSYSFPSSYDAEQYPYYMFLNVTNVSNAGMYFVYSDVPIRVGYYYNSSTYKYCVFYDIRYTTGTLRSYRTTNGVDWYDANSGTPTIFWTAKNNMSGYSSGSMMTHLVESNHDIYDYWGESILYDSLDDGGASYDENIGYLQGLTLKNAYEQGALYNYDESTLTRRWSYSQTTTTGIDLLSGDYLINHYIKPVAVSGYEKEDVKKEFDLYLMKTYEASPLYLQYLQTDYDDILSAQGYDGLGFVEMYLKGWFILYHHYFQIVDNATGAVGGYVHMYPCDASGDSFGIEYVGETLDNNMKLDENGYSGAVSKPMTGGGETIEDAFENAKPESEKGIDFSGVEEFASVMESYVGQVSNVTQGIGSLFNSLPPWLLVTLAIGISLTVFLGVIKIIRG